MSRLYIDAFIEHRASTVSYALHGAPWDNQYNSAEFSFDYRCSSMVYLPIEDVLKQRLSEYIYKEVYEDIITLHEELSYWAPIGYHSYQRVMDKFWEIRQKLGLD